MKHLLPATLALSMLAGPAAAQGSGVTLYGIVDNAVEIQHVSAGSAGPARTSRQLVSGTFSASRFGFKGSEELGDGLRAFFQLEDGFNSDDGTITGAAFWGRKAIVGLGSNAWGDLWMGRDYTPAFWVQYFTDVNAFAMYGNSGTMSAFALTGMLRASNGVFYASPEFKGLRARLTYTFGDESPTAPTDVGKVLGLSLEYRSPTLSAGAYHQTRRVAFPANGSTSASSVYEGVTALYDFGGWAAGGGFTRYDPAGPDTATSGATRSLWASVQVRFGQGDLRLNIGRINTAVSVPTQGRSTLVGINYNYALSKRTNLYAGVGQTRNNVSAQLGLEGASRAIPNNGRDSDTTAAGAGIRVTF
ncbi:porin [Pelomonas sp. KK5]|uniref:porin n=1 Tax=Pelomonas sp. KK5 TaxID=1855730 RepID=UPI00097BB10F|nr:porin [Pelomonas sp. KK5]